MKSKNQNLIKEDVKVNRKVSDSLKKYVAANQKWKCNMCNNLLEATYEVDHINPLYKGGSNEFHIIYKHCVEIVMVRRQWMTD
jgi:hypothetical protein